MGSGAAPRPPEAHRWRHGEGAPGEVTGGSPATLPSPQIVSWLGNSPTGPGREQAVPTFFPQVAPAAFLRPFPQGPGRPSRETFAGRNLGGSPSPEEALLLSQGRPRWVCRARRVPGHPQMCVPLSRTPCVCTLLWHGAVAVGVDVYVRALTNAGSVCFPPQEPPCLRACVWGRTRPVSFSTVGVYFWACASLFVSV